jgi:serine/threonine protein kinase
MGRQKPPENSMTPERLRQIEELYHSVREREPSQRAEFLAAACQGDEELHREVESLLASNASNAAFLEEPMREAVELLDLQRSGSQPQLAAGFELGSYRIVERVGAGGMGEVYRATDTKLGRSVALKIIRAELLENPENLRRFEREARALASLNHPRVAAIHGLEEFGGTKFLVLEYVPGPTLAERLRRGPLPIREAMLICKQIAEGLEAAHAKGIIHRDLKPANIKVSEDGQVKVLDFGLAKSVQRRQAGPADSTATLTEALTAETTVVGTAAYMSPEQACGKELDSRTDIWSFGCVLYEALTATRAFRGETVTDILAAVIEREPHWEALRAGTPAPIQSLLRRCLRKDPQTRLRDIGDARIELEDALSGPSPETAKEAGTTRRNAIAALAGAAAGAAGVGVFGISRWRGPTPRNLTRFSIPLGEGIINASYATRVAISPDGTHLAYVLTQPPPALYIRSLSELGAKLIPSGGGVPFFSPDGRWIGHFDGRAPQAHLRKIGLDGGAPITLCALENTGGGTWADDDTIYFVPSTPGGMHRISAAGGEPQEATQIEFSKGERMHRFPCAIRGAKAVLFTVATSDAETFDDTRIAVFETNTGQRKTLIEGGTHARYSPSGHLVYARGGNLLAIRMDPKSLQTAGQPFTVLEGLLMSRNSGVANFDISASGDLVYVPGAADKGERTLFWVDRSGKADPLPLPARAYLHPRLSPDSSQLAIEIEGPNHDFYVYDFARDVLTKMTTDGESHWPLWWPDGTELVYRAGHMTAWKMWKMPADRSRSAEQLSGTGASQSAESVSPNGRSIAYTTTPPGGPSQIMVESLDGDHQSRQFVDVKAAAGSPKFSPDGRWLAYCSNESGKPQVFVQAFPGPGAKIQVSNDGGTDPVWKRNGGELYFRNGDKMMVVSVSTAPAFAAGRPQMLWEGHFSHGMSSSCGPPGATSSNYDVTADGRRFLMIKDEAPDTTISKQIVVVLGWAGELNRIERSKSGQA